MMSWTGGATDNDATLVEASDSSEHHLTRCSPGASRIDPNKAEGGVGSTSSTTTKQPEPAGHEPIGTPSNGVKSVAVAK